MLIFDGRNVALLTLLTKRMLFEPKTTCSTVSVGISACRTDRQCVLALERQTVLPLPLQRVRLLRVRAPRPPVV